MERKEDTPLRKTRMKYEERIKKRESKQAERLIL